MIELDKCELSSEKIGLAFEVQDTPFAPGPRSGPLHIKTGAGKMNIDFSNALVTPAQHDLVTVDRDEPAQNRVATCVVRCHPDCVAGLQTQQRATA